MKKTFRRISLLIVLAIVTSMFTNVTYAQAASVWSFICGSGKKVEVNDTITLQKNEYQDLNIYKSGKEIKTNDSTYKITWSSSNPEVVWINASTGKLRADRLKKMTTDTGTAKIIATIKNLKTGAVAKRGFTINVIKEKVKGYLDLTSVGWASYNAGLNENMTGGTAGKLYPGAKLEIINEKTNANGVLVCRVYAPDLGVECYVNKKYIKLESEKVAPTVTPTVAPTVAPTLAPTATPTVVPTATPTPVPAVTKVYGTLDLSSAGWKSYNAGLNANMDGGTAGTLYPGAKLEILEECTNAKGTLVYKVYSGDLNKECYVTAKYVKVDSTVVPPQTTPGTVTENDKVYGTLTATRYNVGINANFTGGTWGEIKKGAQLEILEEVTNSSGNKVYRVYSPDLEKECYVSARYVTINEESSKVILANIVEGVYAIHPKCAPNSSLDVADWNTDNGANLQIWETTKLESNQLFCIKRENGYYVLQSEFSKKMIDVAGGVFASQTNVQLYEANSSDAQKWIITDAGNGYYMLIPYGNQNLALDVSGGGSTNGSNMWLYEINKSDAQLFKLERYYGSTEGLSRYECFSRNASIVLEQIKNGISEFINVGDQACQKLWTWYYQRASSHDGAWCDVFAHYVLCLAGVDTQAYKEEKYEGNQYNVGWTREYYKDFGAYTYVADANKSGMDIYDMVRTGDLILMNGYNHIGVVYVEGDKKYVVHGNYSGKVCVHELSRRDASTGVNYANGKMITVDGYVSMEVFLSNNTDVEVSRELPTEKYQIGNYILGGMR